MRYDLFAVERQQSSILRKENQMMPSESADDKYQAHLSSRPSRLVFKFVEPAVERVEAQAAE